MEHTYTYRVRMIALVPGARPLALLVLCGRGVRPLTVERPFNTPVVHARASRSRMAKAVPSRPGEVAKITSTPEGVEVPQPRIQLAGRSLDVTTGAERAYFNTACRRRRGDEGRQRLQIFFREPRMPTRSPRATAVRTSVPIRRRPTDRLQTASVRPAAHNVASAALAPPEPRIHYLAQ